MKTGIVVFIGNPLKTGPRRSGCKKDRVLKTVGDYYNVDIFKNTRKRSVVFARQVAMSLLRKMKIGVEDVAQVFSLHYTTVSYATKTIQDQCDVCEETKRQILEIESMLE